MKNICRKKYKLHLILLAFPEKINADMTAVFIQNKDLIFSLFWLDFRKKNLV